jgi:hydrogenase nickel incorporation protein HypB
MMIGKTDVAPAFDFDIDACKERVRKLNPDMVFFEVSALKGDGFDEFIEWLTGEIEKFRNE